MCVVVVKPSSCGSPWLEQFGIKLSAPMSKDQFFGFENYGGGSVGIMWTHEGRVHIWKRLRKRQRSVWRDGGFVLEWMEGPQYATPEEAYELYAFLDEVGKDVVIQFRGGGDVVENAQPMIVGKTGDQVGIAMNGTCGSLYCDSGYINGISDIRSACHNKIPKEITFTDGMTADDKEKLCSEWMKKNGDPFGNGYAILSASGRLTCLGGWSWGNGHGVTTYSNARATRHLVELSEPATPSGKEWSPMIAEAYRLTKSSFAHLDKQEPTSEAARIPEPV